MILPGFNLCEMVPRILFRRFSFHFVRSVGWSIHLATFISRVQMNAYEPRT